jgi:hypothetical protein
MWTGLIGLGYAEEAGCSANTKGMPSYGKGMKHIPPREQQPSFKERM